MTSRTTILILCLLALACKKDPYPAKLVQNELVVLAEITAGSSLKIPVSKSIQVGNGGIISFDKVTTANVTVTPDMGSAMPCTLSTSSSFATDPASVYISPHAPTYGKVYHLKVTDPVAGTVTATTTVPAYFKIYAYDTSSGVHGTLPVLTMHVALQDQPDTPNLYVFEALKELLHVRHLFTYQGKIYDYDTPSGLTLWNQVKGTPGVVLRRDTVSLNKFLRLAIYTDDPNVDNARVSSLDSSFERIFLPDKVFNGQRYDERIYIDRSYFQGSGSLGPGRVLLMVKSVSPELYNYLFWYEQYKSAIESLPPDQLYSPPGNVQNGLGIFGGSSKHQWVYYFDDLY